MYGGVETFLVTLARNRGLCPEMEPEFALCFKGRLADELAEADAPVHILGEVRARNPLSVLRARRRLAHLLSTRRVDVVVCHMPWVHAIFGSVAKHSKLPLVFWLHSATTGRHWVERWASMTRPDAAAAPSVFCAATVRRIFPGVIADPIYYPIAAPPGFTDEDRRETRLAQNTAPDSVVIIQAGRMAAFKGYEEHIRALGLLREEPWWTCWIVGGPQRAEEEAFVAKLKAVATSLGIVERLRFLGQRSDVARLLHAADIYCQPNISPEGLPIIFGEAMHAGLPVVSSALGGFEESVDPACGVLVEPANPEQLARVLRRLGNDAHLRSAMGARGRAKVSAMANPAAQLPRVCGLMVTAMRNAGVDLISCRPRESLGQVGN